MREVDLFIVVSWQILMMVTNDLPHHITENQSINYPLQMLQKIRKIF